MFKKLLFAAFAFSTITASAQTVDEIVAKNIEAMGGAAKIATLTSTKMTGSMSMQGQEIPMTFTTLHQKGSRMDIEIMGTSNYQIITPEKGYMFFPIQQMTEPKEMEAEQVAAEQGRLNVQGVFYNYKENGTTIEFIANEKVDGVQAYKLKVTRKSGKSSFSFIDAKTGFVLKTISKAKGMSGDEEDMETTLSDYKQNKDGYWFPYTITSARGPIVFETIETNIKVDENIFKN
ncbi:MAG: hypothetical protein ABL929_10630 [Ferruginibacter sp.]|nr:hypothetical protein [Ferruginibacter sp.]